MAFDNVPVELCEKVLSYISNPPDKYACYRTCPLWNTILWRDRTQFLFQEILPFLLPYLDKRSVLACRQVCRGWCRGVNNVVPDKDPHRFTTNLFRHWDMSEILNGFLTSMDAADPFYNQIFVGRSVSIGYSPIVTQRFLPTYGFKIHTIKIFMQVVCENVLQLMAVIETLLLHMPCLEQFIFYNEFNFLDEDHPLTEDTRRLLRSIEFSETFALKTVDIRSGPRNIIPLQYNTLIVTQLANQNSSRLEELHTVIPVEFEATIPFPNLKTFTIYEKHLYVRDQLQSLLALRAPLETLLVHYFISPEQQLSLSVISELFLTAEHFGSTLTKLCVTFYGVFYQYYWSLRTAPVAGVDYQIPTLELPHIKCLALKGLQGSDRMSFDFLIGLPSMEKFTFSFELYWQGCKEPDDEPMVIEIHKYLDLYGEELPGKQLYRSNIWTVLPKLNFISVATSRSAYTRREYLQVKNTL